MMTKETKTRSKRSRSGGAKLPVKAVETAPKPVTKIAQILVMLRRKDGATLLELVTATGWLPHTVRAALTGLRKNGHAVLRAKQDSVSRYSLTAAG
jgi:DNA-binding transcriptional regulator PaaX